MPIATGLWRRKTGTPTSTRQEPPRSQSDPADWQRAQRSPFRGICFQSPVIRKPVNELKKAREAICMRVRTCNELSGRTCRTDVDSPPTISVRTPRSEYSSILTPQKVAPMTSTKAAPSSPDTFIFQIMYAAEETTKQGMTNHKFCVRCPMLPRNRGNTPNCKTPLPPLIHAYTW